MRGMHTWMRSPLVCKVRGRAGEALEARPCWPDPPLTLSSLVPNAPCLYPKSPDITRYGQGYAVAKTDDGRDILPRGDPLFHAQRPNRSGAAQLDAHAPTPGRHLAWSTDRPVGENRWMSRSPDDIARALLVATHGEDHRCCVARSFSMESTLLPKTQKYIRSGGSIQPPAYCPISYNPAAFAHREANAWAQFTVRLRFWNWPPL